MSNRVKQKYKILFADSQESILTVFKIFENELNEIENGAFECEFTTSGIEVLEKLKTGEYDLAVIDYYLSDLDGLSILEELAFSDIKVPVIFQTVRGNEEVAIHSFRLGLKDYFIKSQLSFEELYSAIMNALNNENELAALTPVAEIPSLNFLTHHLEAVLKGYQQEMSEDDLVPGQEYIFAFMSVKVLHDKELEKTLSYNEIKAIYRNIRTFINNTAESYSGMKWIDKEDFLMYTFVGKNLVSNCFVASLRILMGGVMYNLAQRHILHDFSVRIALNYGEAKYEANKEVLVSSSLNYNVHTINHDNNPGLYVSEFFHANMDEKSVDFFEPDFELEGIQNLKFNLP